MWEKEHSEKFKTPNYSKEYFRKPIILKLIGDVNEKDFLEIGCGSGYWTRIFAGKGAKCVGIDIEDNQLDIARKEEAEKPLGIKYLKLNASNMSKIDSNSIDVVFIEFVLLEIKEKNLVNKVFKEAYRVLRKGGLLFISDMHPFDPFFSDKYELPKGFHYYSSGGVFYAKATQLDGSIIKFRDYHWTFEDLLGSIINARFQLTDLREPKASESLIKKFPYFEYRRNLPKTLMLKAEKV